MGWRPRWPMGHGSHRSWVKSSLGHLGHGSLWVTHSLLWVGVNRHFQARWISQPIGCLSLPTSAVVLGWCSTFWRRRTSTLRRLRPACPTALNPCCPWRVDQRAHLPGTGRSRRTRCCRPGRTVRWVDSRRLSDRHESLGCELAPIQHDNSRWWQRATH